MKNTFLLGVMIGAEARRSLCKSQNVKQFYKK